MSFDRSNFAALIGIDWADKEHALSVMDTATGEIQAMTLPHRPDAIEQWAQDLHSQFEGRQLAVALELSKGPLVYALVKYEFLTLFPILPTTLAKYRDTWTPSGAKDDPTDADLILDLLQRHGDKLKPWTPQSPEIRQLGQLVEMRRALVDDAVRITNRITTALKNYYPIVLDLFTEKNTILFCDFLLRWPEFKDLKKARLNTIEQFFLSHRSCSVARNKERITLIKQAIPLTEDYAVIMPNQLLVSAMAEQLRTLLASINQFDQQINQIYQNHPDAHIFDSLPGAANALSPRLMAAFGEERDHYQSADDINKYAGIAPVTESSGNKHWVHWRYICPIFLRQTSIEWANQSIKFSFWARAYYLMQRERGKTHQVAIRALAFKWIWIIYRCWQNHTPYDESKYLMVLQDKGSPLLKNMANIGEKT